MKTVLLGLAELMLHPLNELVRDGDLEELKRGIAALGRDMAQGWRDGQVGHVIPLKDAEGKFVLVAITKRGEDGKPVERKDKEGKAILIDGKAVFETEKVQKYQLIGAGRRFRAWGALAAAMGKIGDTLASEFRMPCVVEDIPESEVGARINVLNFNESGAGGAGFIPHELHHRLTLAAPGLPPVDFVGQKTYSTVQVETACGISRSSGSQREFSRGYLTLASKYEVKVCLPGYVSLSGDVRTYMTGQENAQKGIKAGLIQRLERALILKDLESVEAIGVEFKKCLSNGWKDVIVEGSVKKKSNEQKLSEAVATARTNAASVAASEIEKVVLLGKSEIWTTDRRVALDLVAACPEHRLSEVIAILKPKENGDGLSEVIAILKPKENGDLKVAAKAKGGR